MGEFPSENVISHVKNISQDFRENILCTDETKAKPLERFASRYIEHKLKQLFLEKNIIKTVKHGGSDLGLLSRFRSWTTWRNSWNHELGSLPENPERECQAISLCQKHLDYASTQ